MRSCIKFNCNDTVRVQLTEVGLRELKRQNKKCPPEVDGWSEWQLHDLMSTLGHLMRWGLLPPFNMDVELLNYDKAFVSTVKPLPIIEPSTTVDLSDRACRV